MSSNELWHGTTILAVRKNGKVVIAGDGQVTWARRSSNPTPARCGALATAR